MKRLVISLIVLFISLAGMAAAAPQTEMSIQVDETQLRATPAFYGSVVGTVSYADRLRILERKGAWVRAANPKNNITGWIHISALTSKKLAPRSGSRNAPTSVSSGELSAAEKGFTEQIEKDYRQKNRSVDFTWVDKMEKIRVTPQQSAAFLKEGQVQSAEGGEK